MGVFVRSTATIAAVSLNPFSSSSSTSSTQSSFSSLTFKPRHSSFLSLPPFGLVNSFTPLSAATMDPPASHQSEDGASLPELMTEFMVDMSCDGCVKAVRTRLQTVEGVKSVEVDLSTQVVRVLGTSPVKTLSEALEQTGRKARLIGQGVPDNFLVSAAVSEFKGPNIFGVVRFAQVSMELARIEATFSGLSPGKHSWTINEYGDLTRGAASTGKIYNPTNQEAAEELLGDLGTLDADEKGEAFFSGVKRMLRVADIIGRSVVVYETEDKSVPGITAAVIARSAGVGENYKKLCTCDGTTIWEATNSDFITSKV
uniref:Superoxide dismutase copper chaperone n=1 Tax=Kalanchoe fedtschenkoi TaxID=63787 RepID=A0A7N0TVM4_KALFE